MAAKLSDMSINYMQLPKISIVLITLKADDGDGENDMHAVV
jgi:hypothetical protein